MIDALLNLAQGLGYVGLAAGTVMLLRSRS